MRLKLFLFSLLALTMGGTAHAQDDNGVTDVSAASNITYASGVTPVAISLRILWVITRVFPAPAPASTRSGPSRCSTACFWASLRGCFADIALIIARENSTAFA